VDAGKSKYRGYQNIRFSTQCLFSRYLLKALRAFLSCRMNSRKNERLIWCESCRRRGDRPMVCDEHAESRDSSDEAEIERKDSLGSRLPTAIEILGGGG
jgi:hypothetical protein